MEIYKCVAMAVTAVLLGVIVFLLVNLQPTKCDMCGAMVHDTWSVYNGEEFIQVCERCVNDIDNAE